MKMLLAILTVCSTVVSAPDCFYSFQSAAEKIERPYKRAQARHEYSFPKEHYIYQFFPVSMFPFFCIPKDTLDTMPIYEPIFYTVCENYYTNFGVCFDKLGSTRIQIAILQYVKIGRNLPWAKTYTIYCMLWDSAKKDWIYEKEPISLLFTIKNDCTYQCISATNKK